MCANIAVADFDYLRSSAVACASTRVHSDQLHSSLCPSITQCYTYLADTTKAHWTLLQACCSAIKSSLCDCKAMLPGIACLI